MYSPTIRLLTVLELLQSYKQMSGSEIARRLEINPRTVRRYIVMLQDMGIPVEGERGSYGAYHLERGYKMPPLMFTDAEAIAVTLGLLAIRAFNFPVDVAAVEGALAKTERVMPEKLLEQARGLQEAIVFNVSPSPVILQNDVIGLLSRAVQQHRQVVMRYRAIQGDESERAFDPYGIVFNEGYWYTAGYCHLREDLRTFRLDRIVQIEMGMESFEPPSDFDLMGHVMQSISSWSDRDQIVVMMETTLKQAQQFIQPVMGSLEAVEGGVIFRRAPYQMEWIAHILTMVDFPVHIIQPPQLRDMMRHIAAKALQIAEDSA